jgi:Mce-associated membrane protein
VSGGARQSAADTKSVPVNEDEIPGTAAEIRALAEQAEAEAAEAEALAAAARARARAIQLRRQAKLVEEAETKETKEVATAEPVTKEVATKAAVTEEDLANATETVEGEEQVLESEDVAEDATTAVEPERVETEESPDAAEEEPEAAISSDQAEKKPVRLRRLRRRPKWSTIAAAVAVLIIIAALSGSVYMVLDHRNAARKRERVAEFTAAARQGVVTLTSLDFNHAKEGVQRILENSTGSFKDDFLKMADDFTKVVEQSKVISQGSVSGAAVESDTMTDDSAVVLVASTSEVTNAAGAKQDPRNYRLIVTVARDGGQLKISKVEFVP